MTHEEPDDVTHSVERSNREVSAEAPNLIPIESEGSELGRTDADRLDASGWI